MSFKWEDVAIIMPAYNEASQLEPVIIGLRLRGWFIIVVDDGSVDQTYSVAKRCADAALKHCINRGQGASLQTGINYALEAGFEYIVTFDSDGQHQAYDVERLINPILKREAEIVLGSRFLTDNKIPFTRRITLRLAILFTKLITGMKITDTHNGLRAFSRRAAGQLSLKCDRSAHASEILDQIKQTRLPYIEVPVTIEYTEYSTRKGQRSIAAIRILFDYLISKVI